MTISEIDLKLKTIQIEGGCTKKMTIRNIFYIGIFGKIETIYYWLKYHRKKYFKEYLEFPVTYNRESNSEIGCFQYIDAEKELNYIKGEEKWYPIYAPHIILGTNKSILDKNYELPI